MLLIELISIILCSIFLLIYIILQTYYVIQGRLILFSGGNEIPFFKSRHPVLVTLINVVCTIIMIVERPIFLFNQLSKHNKNNYSEIFLFNLPFWSLELLFGITWFGLFICICLKFYLLYYYERLNLAVVNQAWQKEINVGITDWYISNSQRWGNPIWLIKVSIIPYLFVVGLAVTPQLFAGKNNKY